MSRIPPPSAPPQPTFGAMFISGLKAGCLARDAVYKKRAEEAAAPAPAAEEAKEVARSA